MKKAVTEKAEGFGLHLEPQIIPGNGQAVKVYKGARQIFIGAEESLEEFLDRYEKERPAPYSERQFGYKE